MLSKKKIVNILGKPFADHLDELIIDVGHLQFSRRTMIDKVGCANFIAARRLHKVLRRLSITSAAQLYRTDPFSLARVRGIGAAALFVAACVLDASGYDVEVWWGWKESNVVKFSTFKHNATMRAQKRKQDVA